MLSVKESCHAVRMEGGKSEGDVKCSFLSCARFMAQEGIGRMRCLFYEILGG